jgi:hypothetical protein
MIDPTLSEEERKRLKEAAQEREEEENKKLELRIGLTVAFFATLLSIVDLRSGAKGDDEMQAFMKHNEQYSWYQSKSIKENLKKSEIETLKALKITFDGSEKVQLDSQIAKIQRDVDRYKAEATEIKQGSANVGKDKWAQEDAEGKLGNIIGADEHEYIYEVLGDAGDTYDQSNALLQICVLFGAVAFIIQTRKVRFIFWAMTVAAGVGGIYFFWAAEQIVAILK